MTLCNKKRTQKRRDFVVLVVSSAVTEAQWAVTVVNPGIVHLIYFHRWFRVARWQFLSQMVIKTRMYHKPLRCH